MQDFTTPFYYSKGLLFLFLSFGGRIEFNLGGLQEFLEFRNGVQVSQCGRCPQTAGLNIGGIVVTGNHTAAAVLKTTTQDIVGCFTRAYLNQ